MKIINDYRSLTSDSKGSVVALGNFDGVHKGHIAVIQKTKEIAGGYGASSSVLTFEPHPLTLLRKNIKPFRLTSAKQKADILENLGVDNLFIMNFTQEFLQMKAADFIKDILVDSLNARHIVTGEDFIFGHNREGSAIMLQQASEEYGFGYSRVLSVGSNQNAFSSSLIRKELEIGNLSAAKAILGRNFKVAGMIEKGAQKGRTIGFPTININMGEYLRPAFGVYAAKLRLNGRSEEFIGAVNIGVRPTVDGAKELLEMHIFDFDENIYGLEAEVELIECIRPELKFENLEGLSKQIESDCNKIRKILA